MPAAIGEIAPVKRVATTSVVLADAEPLLLHGLRAALGKPDRLEVVGEAQTAAALMELVVRVEPEFALVDDKIACARGFACLSWLRERQPPVKVMLLGERLDTERGYRALSLGACGYVSKNVDPRDLAAAIRLAAEETAVVLNGVPEPPSKTLVRSAGLTEREVAVLAALGSGWSNKAIARQLGITETTVKHHATNVYRKLELDGRAAAIRYAYRIGLSELPESDDDGHLPAAVPAGI